MSRIVLDNEPLNAQDPVSSVVDSFITPESKLFDRNHGDIPQLDAASHKIHFEVSQDLDHLGLKEFTLNMPDLYRAASGNVKEVIAALQCAGNRRSEMSGLSGHKEAEGLPWVSRSSVIVA